MIRNILACLALLAGLSIYADTVSYTYDDAGRLTSVTYASGAAIQYTYDAAGNVTSVTITPAPNAQHKEKKNETSPAAKSMPPERRDRAH